MRTASVREVIRNHRAFFLDHYGVLRNAQGPIRGTEAACAQIVREEKAMVLVSNTSSVSLEDTRASLSQQSLLLAKIPVVTSGTALKPFFAERGLRGKKVFCIGNTASDGYVSEAGGIVLHPRAVLQNPGTVDVVVIAGNPIVSAAGGAGALSLEIINAAINILRMRAEIPGIITNTDEIIPCSDASVILGCGAIGKLIESCSRRILERVGKPHLPIYNHAFSFVPGIPREEIVMVGDSEQDVVGAKNAGIKSLLVLSGNTRAEDVAKLPVQPDYIAPAFVLD